MRRAYDSTRKTRPGETLWRNAILLLVLGAGQGWSDAGSGYLSVVRQLGPLQERRAPEAVSICGIYVVPPGRRYCLRYLCRLSAAFIASTVVLPVERNV